MRLHLIDLNFFDLLGSAAHLGVITMFYIYLRPLTTQDEGLYALACEEDVRYLATLARSFKLIKVYIEHGVTTIDSYLRAPRFRATLEEITDEPKINGEAGFADVTGSGVDTSGLSHDESFGVDDLDLKVSTQEPIVAEVSTQEPIVAEVSTEQDELASNNRQFLYDDEGIDTAYETKYDVQSSEDVGTDNDDDDDVHKDFLVDEENEIVKPDVDVNLFGKDVDVIDADSFDSDPSNDEEKNYRKRRLAELKTEVEGALKLGFRACRRNLLGLDGAFMKGSFPGQVLVVIGLDSNNGIYPLAYELVEAKSRGKSDLLLNNIYEVFIGKIVRGRDRPELTGISYKHVVAACWNMSLNDRAKPPLETWVNPCYWLSTWKETYSYTMQLICGTKYWEKSTCPTPLLPPKHHIQVGRPRKKRKMSKHKDEPFVKDGKLSRKGRSITCQSCRTTGHNKATCKGQGGSGASVVIGLSAAAGDEGGASGPGGAGIASKGSSHSRWIKRRVNTKRISPQKRTPTQPASQPSTSTQVPMSKTRNVDGTEMGNGVPAQLSTAVSDNGNFPMVDKEEVTSKKLAPMAEEMIMRKDENIMKCQSRTYGNRLCKPLLCKHFVMNSTRDCTRKGLGGGGYLRDDVRVVGGTDDGGLSMKLVPDIWVSTALEGTDVMKKASQENVGEEEVHLNNNIGKQIGYFVDMPSEAVEQGMDANLPDEIFGAKGEQVPNHVVKKDNLEFLVCKEVANPGVNELVDNGRPLKRKMIQTPSWPNGATVKLLNSSPSRLSYHPSAVKGIKHCKRWYWNDPELENKWYRTQLYEMHLLLNPSKREELENELTSREELVVLQVEFADTEGQMQQLMEELKKSQKMLSLGSQLR
uniref:Transposase, mutator type n=1 Tax=Tanacetum cinerariifolium TaxID=118510 RepID=A0A6L2JK16_TANCI|nr:hypothetical protein [Tanacetum cinerariifolium]